MVRLGVIFFGKAFSTWIAPVVLEARIIYVAEARVI